MTDRLSLQHEYPSKNAEYFASGKIKRIPHDSVPASCGLTGFRIIDAKKVRKAAENSTVAYEIELEIIGNDQAAAEMQPGAVFAFEPRNHTDVVNAVLMHLKHENVGQEFGQPLDIEKLSDVASQEVKLPVKSAYIQSLVGETLSKREILSGVYDLGRPTLQLVNKVLKNAGNPETKLTPQEMAASYSIEQLLEEYPGYITVEDLCANQPQINTRPYTISDIDRKKGTLKIIVSDVDAEIPSTSKGAKPKHKLHGVATRMLVDLVEKEDHSYTLNGYLANHGPKVFFPGITELTECIDSYRKETDIPYWQEAWDKFASWKDNGSKTLFLLGTGSGIAPYMAMLRELERRKEDKQEPYPHKIVLINGGRGKEGKLFNTELEGFKDSGILHAYHYVDSTPDEEGNKTHIQDVLHEKYGEVLKELLLQEQAAVYVCGTKAAKDGVADTLVNILSSGKDRKEPQEARAFVQDMEDKFLFQSTASVPARFYNLWAEQNEATHSRKPKRSEAWQEKLGGKPPANAHAPWTTRILNIVQPEQRRL